MAGIEWSKKGTAPAVRGDMKLMFLDEVAPNAFDKNVLGLVDHLADYIRRGIQPLPEGAEWVNMPTVTASGFTLSVDGTGHAKFSGASKFYTGTSYTVTAAGANLLYNFVIFARPDGTYGTTAGQQSQNPTMPPLPSGTLYVSHALVSSASTVVQEPVDYVTSKELAAELAKYLPVIFDKEYILSAGAFDFGHEHAATLGDGSTVSGEYRTYDGIPYSNMQRTLPNGDTAIINENVYGDYSFPMRRYKVVIAGQEYISEVYQKWENGIMSAGWQINTPNGTFSFEQRSDGKLYLNGVEFTGGGNSSPSLHLGTYTSLANLQAAHPTAAAGNSADVDAGAGTDVVRYIWDVSDAKWVKGGGTTTSTGSGQNRAAAEAFSSLITFDKNKVLFLGGTGNTAFTQNYTFGNVGTCVDDSYAIIIIIGNGSNTCSVDGAGGWKKENNGVFNPASGMKNVIRMHYINENNKFYTITQPN